MSKVYYIEVSSDEDGQRLDRFLQKHLKGTPISLLQKLMRKGQVRVDSKRVQASTRLVQGQSVRIPPLEDKSEKDQSYKVSDKDAALMRSIVLYDDGDIIALNKPAGLATQGGTNVKKHIDGLLEVLKNKEGVVPRLVHRLDKDTSGLLLLARSADMARRLGKIFQNHDIRKIYWAITMPAPSINSGEIKAPLKKAEGVDKEKMIVDEEGQFALTLFDVVERAHTKMAFVAFWPKTGRTHQIRVHAVTMGCPILGDWKYGIDQEEKLEHERQFMGIELPKRLHLHARSITFKHPKTGKTITLQAPLDSELKASWENLGFDANTSYPAFNDVR